MFYSPTYLLNLQEIRMSLLKGERFFVDLGISPCLSFSFPLPLSQCVSYGIHKLCIYVLMYLNEAVSGLQAI